MPDPDKAAAAATKSYDTTDRILLIISVVINSLVLIALLFLVYHIVRDSKSVVSTIKQVPGIVEQFRKGLGENANKLTSVARREVLPLVNQYIRNATKKISRRK